MRLRRRFAPVPAEGAVCAGRVPGWRAGHANGDAIRLRSRQCRDQRIPAQTTPSAALLEIAKHPHPRPASFRHATTTTGVLDLPRGVSCDCTVVSRRLPHKRLIPQRCSKSKPPHLHFACFRYMGLERDPSAVHGRAVRSPVSNRIARRWAARALAAGFRRCSLTGTLPSCFRLPVPGAAHAIAPLGPGRHSRRPGQGRSRR